MEDDSGGVPSSEIHREPSIVEVIVTHRDGSKRIVRKLSVIRAKLQVAATALGIVTALGGAAWGIIQRLLVTQETLQAVRKQDAEEFAKDRSRDAQKRADERSKQEAFEASVIQSLSELKEQITRRRRP